MTRNDWLLLAVAQRKGQPLTPVQVQKAMFLVRMEAQSEVGKDFYEFVPYNYGPFNSEIYGDLESLAHEGMINIGVTDVRGLKTYTVTSEGMEKAKVLSEQADKRAVDFVRSAVDWVAAQSFPQLLRAIYEKYPKYKENSVFSG